MLKINQIKDLTMSKIIPFRSQPMKGGERRKIWISERIAPPANITINITHNCFPGTASTFLFIDVHYQGEKTTRKN